VFRSDFGALILLILTLGGCGSTAPSSHISSSETIFVTVSGSWPEDAVREQLTNAHVRFADCGIGLKFTSSSAGSQSTPTQKIAHFVQSLELVDGKAIEGRALTFSNPKLIEIAWAASDGTPLNHKQTTAHELGHLFGLGHTALHSINLMAPHSCELCRFSKAQCAVLSSKAGPSLRND